MADAQPAIPPSVEQPRPRRPFGVTLFALLVLSSAGLCWVRLFKAVGQWSFWAEFKPYLPAYLASSGLVWGLVGLAAFWGLWHGTVWAPRFIRLAVLVFALYAWLDRLLLAAYPERNTNWSYAASLTFLLLVWVFWILSRHKVRQFFGEVHEQR